MNDERTLYELLGVPRDAGAAQISKAWRRRTRKAGPGSPEFTRLNEAAETLLNPDKRAAYDAELPPEVVDVPASAPSAPASRVSPASAASADGLAEVPPATATGATTTDPSTTTTVETTEPGASAAPHGLARTKPARPFRRGRALAVIAALTVLAVASVVFAVVTSGQHRKDVQTDTARTEATAAARQAMSVILGYSYTTMDADLQRDLPYLTPAFQKTFKTNFALLTKSSGSTPSPVAQTKTVVTVSVLGAAIMDASPTQAHVLVFADQTTVHKAGSDKQQCPCVLQNRVQVSMVKQGGKWLVSDLRTS